MRVISSATTPIIRWVYASFLFVVAIVFLSTGSLYLGVMKLALGVLPPVFFLGVFAELYYVLAEFMS